MQRSIPASRWLTRQPYPSIVDGREASTVDDYRDASVTRAQYYQTEWLNVDLSQGARVTRGTMYVQRFYAETCIGIDIDGLDVVDPYLSVLGQIYGDYRRSPECMFGTRSFRQSHALSPLGPDGAPWLDDARALNVLWRAAFRTWLGRS